MRTKRKKKDEQHPSEETREGNLPRGRKAEKDLKVPEDQARNVVAGDHTGPGPGYGIGDG